MALLELSTAALCTADLHHTLKLLKSTRYTVAGMANEILLGDFEQGPILPTELERVIFLLAFDPRDHVTNTRMTLVAKRVRTWIRRLLYRVAFHVPFNGTRGSPAQSSYPNVMIEDIGHFAHHLLYIPEEDRLDGVIKMDIKVMLFLEHFPNVQDLVLPERLSPNVLKQVHCMRKLRKLSTDLRRLTTGTILRPTFARLTHLHLSVKLTVDWMTRLFSEAVNLTHFGLNGAKNLKHSDIEDILSLCPKLLALVLFDHPYMTDMNIQSMHIDEPRVVLFAEDIFPRYEVDPDGVRQWADDVRGGYDFWDLADLFITARRAGYFNSDCIERYTSEAIDVEFEWGDNLTDKGRDWFKTVQQRFPYTSFVRY